MNSERISPFWVNGYQPFSAGDTKEQHQAIGTWLCDYADSRQSFDEIKNRQTYKEVADVANGAYDWKIERGQRGISL